MALQVGELYASLTMDQGPFDSAMGSLTGKFKKLGGLVTGVIGGAVVGAVGALGGAVVAGVNSANKYQKALNALQTQTGATGKEMASMGDSMKNVYARNFGEDFQDVADTMAFAKQATGTFGEELEYLTQDALMLRDTFGMEVQESLRGADSMMEQFGTTGTQAMAFLAEATQKGLNKNEDLVDSIEEYSVYFANAGLSAEDMFAIFENASNAGVRNLDLVGDTMKEFSIIMKEDGDKASGALTALGLDAGALQTQFAKGGEGARSAYQTIMEAMAGVEDPLKRNQLGVELFGTKFEDLEADAVLAMGNLNGTIEGSVETLDKINQIKYNTFGEAITGIGRQLEVGLLLPIGQLLLPLLNQFANWIATKIPGMIAFFQQLGAQAMALVNQFRPAFEQIKTAVSTFIESFVAGFMQFMPTIEQSKGILAGFLASATAVFTAIWGVVGPIMTLVGQKVMEVVSLIVAWWNSNGAQLLANVQIVFNGIMSVINFVMPLVLAIITMVFNNIKGVVQGALNIISGVFNIFAGLFTGNWSKMWDGVKQLVSGALQFIWNLWQLMLYGKLIAGIKMLGTKALGLFKTMWTGIQNGFGAFTNWITSLVMRLVSNVISKFTNLGSRAVSVFQTMRSLGASVWSALQSAISTVVGRILSGTMRTFNNLKNQAISSFNGLKSRASAIFDSVKTAITRPIESAKNTVLGIVEKIKSAFNNLKIKIPKFKLPKVSITTKKNALFGIDLPSFNVDWFKTGGIATGPAIAGIGEAGSEAIVPLSGRRMKPFSDAIGAQVAQALGGLNVSGGQPVIVEMNIDGRQFARATAKYYDDEQNRKSRQDTRARGYNVE